MARLGVPQFEMLAHVTGREKDGAGAAHEGDAAVGEDCLHGPVIPILHYQPTVGAQGAVVAAGHHLITGQDPLVADPEVGSDGPGT